MECRTRGQGARIAARGRDRLRVSERSTVWSSVSALVQHAEVGGHHAAAGRTGVVVDDGLHDLFVQAGLVRSDAQDLGGVAAGFGEQVPA